MALSVGTKAPDFTLKTKNARGLADVKLSDHLGKKSTLLLFFPLAFTGVCTKEMCDVTHGLNDYQSLGAAVYGISIDSPFTQETWAQREKIGIPLLSDLNKGVAKDYGVLLPDLMGLGSVSARAAFIVDKKGIIQYVEVTPTVKDLPNFNAIKATLKKLK